MEIFNIFWKITLFPVTKYLFFFTLNKYIFYISLSLTNISTSANYLLYKWVHILYNFLIFISLILQYHCLLQKNMNYLNKRNINTQLNNEIAEKTLYYFIKHRC